MSTRNLFSKNAVLSAIVALLFSAAPATSQAQSSSTVDGKRYHEWYGNTVNLGIGPGYFGAFLLPSPYLTANYEFEVARNTTIAPFIGLATYRSDPQFYQGDYYYYRATVIPVGAKVSYYFDDILNASPRWDFYLAGSLGYAYVRKGWESGYHGSVGTVPGVTPLYLDLHIGAEYHINHRTGIFADVSTGVSVVGVALHR